MQNSIEDQERSNNENAICYEDNHEIPTHLCQEKDNKFQSGEQSFYFSDSFQQIKHLDENGLEQQLNYDQCVNVNQYIQSYNDQSESSQEDNGCNSIFGKDSYQYPQSSIQEDLKNVIQTKVYTKIPGETKNLPKCFARRLKEFILSSVENTDDPELKNAQNDSDLKSFLKLKPEQITKSKLDIFIKSDIGSIFCKEFFGSCQWNYGITKEGKTNVDPYFRYNIQYFWKSVKKIKPN
ncbi:unnamed protein product [Paramecium pentaurelia]|uniref:Uncharacterized protein n=1 Tax=Paramecium pentaurelia TaxID=43138 RepID=A0A8S1WLK1_9CILI|nr:unnamed protein product [Paramecium pentaurelia]